MVFAMGYLNGVAVILKLGGDILSFSNLVL
jgi:hypothetical protein